MKKYLLNEKTGVICKEGTSENDIVVMAKLEEKENKFILVGEKPNGEKFTAELSKEDYFEGKEFIINIEKKESKKDEMLTKDIIIEVGQKFSDGHLISYEKKNGVIEFFIDTEEHGEQVFKYTEEEILKLAEKYGIIKVKGIKVVKDNLVMEFDSINDFYKHLLKETGKEKINKGLLYNLKNGKSKSCYGYKLAE